MRYQTYFWDFDGTLFDTYPIMVDAFMQALQRQHVSEIEMDEVEYYEVMRRHSLGTAVQQFSSMYGVDATRLEQDYRRIEATMIENARPFDGIPALLRLIQAQGGQHFLLTHRDKSALTLLAQDDLKDLFTGFVTSEQAYARKPDPESLTALITQYQVDRSTAIMIGDRNLDVEAGHRAGIAGALFDPGRLINSAVSKPEISVTNVIGLRDALLTD